MEYVTVPENKNEQLEKKNTEQRGQVHWYGSRNEEYILVTKLNIISKKGGNNDLNIYGFVSKLTRRVSLVEQELLILPEHLNSPTVFSAILLLDL